jgi:hypothetical protein
VIRVKRVRKWRRPSREKNVLELDVLSVPLRIKGMNRGSSPSDPPTLSSLHRHHSSRSRIPP